MDRVSSWPALSIFLHFRAPKGLAKSEGSSHSRRKKDAGKCGHLPKAGGQCSQQLLQCNLDTSPNLQCHQGRDNHWESENMYLMNKTSVGIKAYPGNSQSPKRSFKHRTPLAPHTPRGCFSDLTTPHKLGRAAQLPFKQTPKKPHGDSPLDIHQTPLPIHMMPQRRRKRESKFLFLRKSASSHPRSSDLAEKDMQKGITYMGSLT